VRHMGINGRLDADENHSFIGLGLPDTNKGVIFYGLIVTGYPLTDIGVRLERVFAVFFRLTDIHVHKRPKNPEMSACGGANGHQCPLKWPNFGKWALTDTHDRCYERFCQALRFRGTLSTWHESKRCERRSARCYPWVGYHILCLRQGESLAS